MSSVYKESDWDLFFRQYGSGLPLISEQLSDSFVTNHNINGEIKIVDVTAMPFKKALRLSNFKQGKHAYMLQASAPFKAVINNNSTVIVSFYARTISTANETGYGQLSYYVGTSQKPWKSWNKWSSRINKDWKKYYLPVNISSKSAKSKLETGSVRLVINAAFNKQVIEVADVKVRNYGNVVDKNSIPKPDVTYDGRNLDAPWRKSAYERIEKHRKGLLKVKVVNIFGFPIKDAQVKINMLEHTFPFGAAFNSHWYNKNINTENGKKYLATFQKNFTRVTHIGALKWPNWFKNRDAAIESVNFLKKQGFEVRGHTLIWPRWNRTPWDGDAEFIANMEANHENWKKLLTDHIRDQAGALQGKLVEWDVLNEPHTHNHFYQKLGKSVISDWFKVSKQSDPFASLFINEGDHLPFADINAVQTKNFLNIIQYLLDNNVPIEGVGFESHFGWHVPHPQKIYDMIEQFSKLGLKIGITEFDQVIEDEQLQADWERDFLTITFSHPNVTEFIRWGVWNGISSRGFINKDWTLKPNGKVWNDLVFNQWWTTEHGQTNDKGIYQTSAFLGKHTVSVSHNGEEKKIYTMVKKKGTEVVIVLLTF